MARTLAEYFGRVQASDVHPYGFGDVVDFTLGTPEVGQFGWVVTNPPFRLSEVFFHRAMSSARLGVAFLTRTVFVEGVGRHARMFAPHPPSKVARVHRTGADGSRSSRWEGVHGHQLLLDHLAEDLCGTDRTRVEPAVPEAARAGR